MRLLISGSTGYVGLTVAEIATAAGHDVHALVRASSDTGRLAYRAPGVTLHCVDAGHDALAEAVASSRPDVTLNLASAIPGGSARMGARKMLDANVIFGAMLCEAVTAAGCRNLVNASTYWLYARDGTYRPNGLYAASKKAMIDVIDHFALNEGMNAISLVLYDIYGPNDWRPKLLPRLVGSIVAGDGMDLTAGEQNIGFSHVDDVARGFLIAAERLLGNRDSEHETFALTPDEILPLRRLGDVITVLTGRSDPNRWGSIPYPAHQIMDPFVGVARLPGWSPWVDLRQGMRELVSEAMAARRPQPELGKPD